MIQREIHLVFLRSTNDGNTWSEILKGYFSSVAVNVFGHVFVTQPHSEYYYKSENNGDTWETGSFPNIFSGANRIRTDGANTLVADNSLTVVISTDRGNTWQEWDTGKKESFTWQMEYSPDGYIYLGTQGQGLYRTRLPITTIPETERFVGVYPKGYVAKAGEFRG